MDIIHQIFIAMFGVVVALLAFGLLIGLGSLWVRCLQLPNDPPFDVYFSTPAPDLIKKPDPDKAKQQAALQAPLQEVLTQARYLCMHALRCRDAYKTLDAITEKSDDEKSVVKKLKPIYHALKDIPEQMETWYKEDGIGAHQKEIEKWHKQHHEACESYEAIINELPPPNKTRLILLMLGLVVSVAMLVAAHMLMG